MNHFPEFASKMAAKGISDLAIRAFKHSYENLIAGRDGMIPEESIEPVGSIPRLQEIASASALNAALLSQVAVVKLNGGLGTSMGLERAKSLLPVRDGLNFLDFIARQILHVRRRHGVPIPFRLLNSFSTSNDSQQFLKQYPELGTPADLELLQSQAPKVDARTLQPVCCPEDPALEWCPPGHGDFYPCLLSSGQLDQWLDAGIKYVFISNSDNLGASLDVDILGYLAESGHDFLMEVAQRTAADRKGGHLARRNGKLLLRESAQAPPKDMPAFQDELRHPYFNTNNLWLRLQSLKEILQANGGFIPLPLIKNAKTVDPRNPHSTPVLQLETAMGAAINLFNAPGAILVPRTRFAPVKTTSDLLALRSDAYLVADDWRLLPAAQGDWTPPSIKLEERNYRLIDQLEAALFNGVPSLRRCRELSVQGAVLFNSRNVIIGNVTLVNPQQKPLPLPPGQYQDCRVDLGASIG